jgi:hypothetical protein
VVEVHHAAFPLSLGGRSNEQAFGDLDFSWAEFLRNQIALPLRKNVPSLYDHDLVLCDRRRGEQSTPLDGAAPLFDFG